MRRVHYGVGFAFVLVFLGTGLFMRSKFAADPEIAVSERMLHRSAHIYILFAALLNLAVAAGYRRRTTTWRRVAQSLASVLLWVAPVVFTAAFFMEPSPELVLRRPITLPGVVTSVASVALLVSASAFERTDGQISVT